MKLQSLFQSKMGKILFSFAIVLLVILLAQSGYKFGQWLYIALH
jgi:hypothetical protein